MKKLSTIIIVFIAFGAGWLLFLHKETPNNLHNINTGKVEDLDSENMKLSSQAFENGGNIPTKYTCDGEDINPQLSILDIPEGTKSLTLIVDDPDAPVGMWDHWLVYNIPPTISVIGENSLPSGASQALNSWGRGDWGGPCPPDKEHRYFFKLYALDTELTFDSPPDKSSLEQSMEGHILAEAELMGRYNRK
jgi:Raf kinase inhibitor-like YbhB/YbcL family protein